LPDTLEEGTAIHPQTKERYPWRKVTPHCARGDELAQFRQSIYDAAFEAADKAWVEYAGTTLRGQMNAKERAFRREADKWTQERCPLEAIPIGA